MLSWRLLTLTVIACFLAGTLSGWRVTVWHYGYVEKTQATHEAKQIGQGAANVIKFNQQWSDAHVKDDCLTRTMPDRLRVLLK